MKISVKGFTLIELLIYISLFSVAAGLMTGILTIVLKVNQREAALVETTAQLDFVMQTISRLTRESSAIIVNATSTDVSNDGQIGSPHSRLVLRMKDSSGSATDRDPIIIWKEGNFIKMSEGSGVNQKTSDLTNNRVIADKLEFTKFTSYPGHDSVSIDMQLTYNSSNPQSQATRALKSAISRVSAATFDSNLTPGSASYTIGQIGNGWGRIFMSDDSAANPAYAFVNNMAMGLFRAGSNILGFSTNGLERMRIDSSGNVGIGTTAPASTLHTQGTSQTAANFDTTGSRAGQIQLDGGASGPGSGGGILFGAFDDVFGNIRGFITNASGYGVGHIIFSTRDATSTTTLTERMRISASGNVGIGTTNPQSSFSVGNSSQFQVNSSGNLIKINNVSYSWPSSQGGASTILTNDASGNLSWGATSGGQWTTSGSDIYNANSGNVGIGVTSPTAKLEVVCPTGSTNIKAGTNQLGCMQTAEEGSATWWTANNTCFTAYGGKLPSAAEWYIAMNNYTLTGETDDYEFVDELVGDGTAITIGSGSLTQESTYNADLARAYRCWIPR